MRAFAAAQQLGERFADRRVAGFQKNGAKNAYGPRSRARGGSANDSVVAPDLEHVAEIHRERVRHGLDKHRLLAALHLEARVLVLAEDGDRTRVGVMVYSELAALRQERRWVARDPGWGSSGQALEARVLGERGVERVGLEPEPRAERVHEARESSSQR